MAAPSVPPAVGQVVVGVVEVAEVVEAAIHHVGLVAVPLE